VKVQVLVGAERPGNFEEVPARRGKKKRAQRTRPVLERRIHAGLVAGFEAFFSA